MSRQCNVILLGVATAFPSGGRPGDILVGEAGAATTDRTATFPDADGVVVLANNSQTLSAKTFSRCRADPLTVSQISAIVGMIAPELAYASDGRKPGEGGGSGTGVYAYYDGTAWRSMCDGAALAA